jgi:tRNA pseudouridine38-40 synthase
MPRLKLTVEYDGTDFVGWQVQPNGRSVQATLEGALAQLLGTPTRVLAAGRTDSGVHARGQVVAFDTERELPMKAYQVGLNGLLPPDVGIVAAQQVSSAFDPRRWAQGKRYEYRIFNGPHRSPLLRRTHWEIFQPLEVERMRRALPSLLGRHDFSAFRASNCQAHHAVRELRVLELEAQGAVLTFAVEGTAFLKHMVRNLVGTLVEVGRGKEKPEWVGQVLASKDRNQAGMTAPPQGLTLVEVFYGEGPRVSTEEVEEEDGE